jgi:hypothetical protein
MPMQSYRRGRFQEFPVEGGEDPDDIVGTGRRADDTSDAVDCFEELADDERDGFDPFDFFLSTEEFSAEVVGFVEDVFLSNPDWGRNRCPYSGPKPRLR